MSDEEKLQRVLAEMAVLIEQNAESDPQLYAFFFQNPNLAFQLVELINNLDEEVTQHASPIYSACIFAFEICVAQFHSASEHNKAAAKSLNQLMNRLAEIINLNKHSLSFWLPILNAFYEVHVELTELLKDAYYDLANADDDLMEEEDPLTHLNSIRDLIHELHDLSIFEIAENFFAQSYAMPADFFVNLIVDLYRIPEGNDIALLTLLYPKAEVREVVVNVLDQIMHQIILSPISLSRLQNIRHWYPESYHPMFDRWIKNQRKRGVIYAPEPSLAKMSIQATEVDGSGSQGIFMHVRPQRKNRLAGLLLKYELGIKDAWVTSLISPGEVKEYYHQAFDENVTLREVDVEYFKLIIEHFLAITIARGEVPGLQFMELQELIGLRLRPKSMDLKELFDTLSIQITPFTPDVIAESLQRSKSWLKNKPFTESWYVENAVIDKIVNHNSSFVDGVKVCRLKDAIDAVFAEEMELHRDKWQFHFLWMALWAKAKTKGNEKIWQDSFLIAYTIYSGTPLKEIPVMKEICHQTVINSIETMRERKTHLSQE